MRRLIPVVFLLAFLLVPAAGIQAQADVSGTWEITWEGPRGPSTTTFVFQQEGQALTGTAQMAMRGPNRGQGQGREVEITDGKVEGNTITFSMTMGMGQRSMSFKFTGTVDGNNMEGTMETPRGENPFKGIRKEG